MIRLFSFCLLPLLTLIAIAAGTAQEPVPAKVTLRLQPAKGQKFVYTTATSFKQKFGEMEMDFDDSITSTYEVLSTEPEGFAMHISISDAKMTAPAGSPMVDQAENFAKQLNGVAYKASYDNRGHAKGLTAEGSNPAAEAVAKNLEAMNIGFLGAQYPEEAVGVGSKWTTPLDMGKMVGAMVPGVDAKGAVPINYVVTSITESKGKKLVGIEYTVKGTVKFTVSGKEFSLLTDSKGKFSLDAANGFPVLSTMEGTNTVDMDGTATVQKMTMTMKLKELP